MTGITNVTNDDQALLDYLKASLETIKMVYNDPTSECAVDGPFRPFKLEDYNKNMCRYREYTGIGSNLFALDLNKFCPLGYIPDIGETKLHGQKYYQLDKFWQDDKVTMKHKCHIVVPCTDTENPGPNGQLSRISGDQDVVAAIGEFANSCQAYLSYCKTGTNEQNLDQRKRLDGFWMFLRRWPFDYRFYEFAPDLDRTLFVESFQLVENIKIKADEDSQSGWETACSFNQCRSDNKRIMGDGSSKTVHTFMAEKITFSASGHDYACDKDNKTTKGADNALLVYDKITKCGMSHVVKASKHLHGMKACLTQMSKLIAICQKCGSDRAKLRWLIGFLHHRMAIGQMNTDKPLQDLKDKAIPQGLLIWELQTESCSLMVYPRLDKDKPTFDELWLTAASKNPLWLASAKSGAESTEIGTVMDLRQSSNYVLKWWDSLNKGEDDSLVKEMVENCRAMSRADKLDYQNLGGIKARMLKLLKDDTTEQKQSKILRLNTKTMMMMMMI